jgi:signal transduction histidine kinase
VLRQLIPAPADWAAVSAAQEQAPHSLSQQPVYEFALAEPQRRDIQVQLFPIADVSAEEAGGYGAILRDVTAERDLVRAKDELVSVVSHELRTPLVSLVGFAELLLARDFAEEERREFLGIMLEEGRRLTALINDFLDLQRIASGRLTVAPTPTDLCELLERAVDAAGEVPTQPIVLDVPSDLPLVAADPDRVRQVLANLLSNARKYSPAGGEIRVAARAVDGAVEVAVTDQGLGIPSEALPQLFQEFYRVDNSDRREIKGTGLGLSICQKLVAAHGGQIWAESAGLGKGSRFTFTLPLSDDGPVSGDVLVVEDDSGFARLLAAELAQRGLTSVRARSAEVALARVATAPPRAVILDLLLPVLQGEDFLVHLHELCGEAVPIIVVVSVKDLTPSEVAELERHGAVAVLRKGSGVAAQAAEAVADALAVAPGGAA